MHTAVKIGRRVVAVAVEGTILIVQPQRTTAALQSVLVPVIKRAGERDITRVLAYVVDPVPVARVTTINPHN